jgi:hypothetical protein
MSPAERLRDEVGRYIKDRCDSDPASSEAAGDIWDDWHRWRADLGLKPYRDRTKWAQEFCQHFERDPNNNRPRYLGVKVKPAAVAAKPAAPALRLVGGAGK